VRTASALLALALGIALAAAPGPAQAEPRAKPKPQTRRVDTVSEKVFRQLKPAQEALAEERYAEARKHLDAIQKGKLSKYEAALVWQAYGYLYSAQEQYTQALDAFEKCVASGGLPADQSLNVRYNLGQLYLANERYARGVEVLEGWFADAENPGPQAYFAIASGHLQLGQSEVALRWAERGLARAEKPRETWLGFTLSLYYEKKRYGECARVLEQLAARFPKKRYWTQLAAIYGELGDERKQLAAYELLYRQGLLTRSRELVSLAQLYLYHGVPYKSAALLDEGLASGEIESSASNWELLADGWIQAREFDRAAGPLAKAAERSSDGNLYVRLAQVYVEREAWDDARGALESALARGGLRDPGQAQLLLGIAHLNAGRRDASRRAFQQAARHDRTRKSAAQWLHHVD
jgi:tetratricopeptide (TPR) repeat protein